MNRDDATAKLFPHGQTHLLRWFDAIDDAGRARLLAQVAALDLDWVARALAAGDHTVDSASITPPERVVSLDEPGGDAARARGEAALRAGAVGTLLVCGGQGTRLGFDGPKGAFAIGPVSGRTLFEVHVDRHLGLGRRYGVVPPLYVMTSEANDAATRALFADNDNFGLPADRLMIFPQGMAPVVSPDGKLLLDARDHIAMSPNGNGGAFAAMRDSGAIDHMTAYGVASIAYAQVDNPLTVAGDARFLGLHLAGASEFSCKAIRKAEPLERVGNFARVDGRLEIVEYIHLPEALAQQTDADGALVYGYGNPGVFLWSRDFVAAQADRTDLPVHRAFKKIPHLDDDGAVITPDAPNGYKLEMFIFDALPAAERTLIVAGERDEEFAPVKNASGVDSPESARALMIAMHRRWLEAAGVTVPEGVAVEIGARFALDADELAARLPAEFRVTGDIFLNEPTH